jgi:arylsulfatase
MGRGGTGALTVNGREIARYSMSRTVPCAMLGDETFDAGLDKGSSVDDRDYQTPSTFTGRLERLVVTLGETTLPRPKARE